MFCAFALWSCSEPDSPEPPPEPVVEAPEPVAPAAPVRTAPEGPLWLLTETKLHRLDGRSSTVVSGLTEPVKGWTLDGEGTPWVYSGGALFKVEDTAAVEVSRPDDEAVFLYLEDLAFGADGTLWGVGPQALVSFDGTTWTGVPQDQRGPDSTQLSEVLVTPDGTVHARTAHTVISGKHGEWTVQDLAALEPGIEFLDDLTLTPDGALWVSFRGDAEGVMVLRDGTWTKASFTVSFDQRTETMAVDADGKLAAIGDDDHELIRDISGEPSITDLHGHELLSRSADGITIDARNRVWARTDRGLVVVGEDGSVAEYVLGTVGLPTEEIVGIAVHQGGPDLGEASVVRQDVTGRILLDGAPVASKDMLLCDVSDILYSDDPCENATVRIEGKTDGNGAFAFSDLPQARYDVLVRLEKWTAIIGARCCAEMTPGETLVLEEISLSSTP